MLSKKEEKDLMNEKKEFETKDVTNETVVIQVSNTEEQPEAPELMSNIDQINQEQEEFVRPNTMEVDASLLSGETSFETKSQQEGKKFSGTLTYEDILSQTKELTDIKKTDIDYLAEDSRLRREKIENLDEHFKDLNAQPLSSIDSYSNYSLVLNKSIWNFNEVEQRRTKLQTIDLALLTHIYLYDGVIIPLDEVQKTLENFIVAVQTNVVSGYPVILNSSIILDILRFDKEKIIPISIANPSLIPPMGVIEWQSFVSNEGNNHLIIETFIKILDNELNNGHECEFYQGTVLVRNASGVTSLFISESAGTSFNSISKSLASKFKENKTNTTEVESVQ